MNELERFDMTDFLNAVREAEKSGSVQWCMSCRVYHRDLTYQQALQLHDHCLGFNRRDDDTTRAEAELALMTDELARNDEGTGTMNEYNELLDPVGGARRRKAASDLERLDKFISACNMYGNLVLHTSNGQALMQEIDDDLKREIVKQLHLRRSALMMIRDGAR